jgi:hypothetical protein
MNGLYNFLNNLTMNEEFIFFYPQKKDEMKFFLKNSFVVQTIIGWHMNSIIIFR